ncbi:hypothetical protein OG535_38230 [Kitasatospora sp. NBC_00085]|uniref:hypothetical protein n=1 Tax=unclassified Kitasatospora TaxID=2633591 RepID=UPI0032493E7A
MEAEHAHAALTEAQARDTRAQNDLVRAEERTRAAQGAARTAGKQDESAREPARQADQRLLEPEADGRRENVD